MVRGAHIRWKCAPDVFIASEFMEKEKYDYGKVIFAEDNLFLNSLMESPLDWADKCDLQVSKEPEIRNE